MTSTPDPMRVQWIYARRDGTLSFQDPPPYQPANPVIGRPIITDGTEDDPAQHAGQGLQ